MSRVGNNPITIPEGVSVEISENINYNYSYISRVFSANTGFTIEKYLLKCKIDKVKELIKFQKFSVKEIAYLLNYNSLSHLSNHFKRETGITPSQFKKQNFIKGDLILDEDKQLCFWKGIEIELTVAEFNLIKSLAQYSGVVKDRNQLMDAMYGDSIYVDDRTIDSHIKRLRKKFRSYDNSFDQIRTRYGSGYSWRD